MAARPDNVISIKLHLLLSIFISDTLILNSSSYQIVLKRLCPLRKFTYSRLHISCYIEMLELSFCEYVYYRAFMYRLVYKLHRKSSTILSLIPSFSLPDVLCNPTDLIWRKGTPFEAMTGRTAPSSDVP